MKINKIFLLSILLLTSFISTEDYDLDYQIERQVNLFRRNISHSSLNSLPSNEQIYKIETYLNESSLRSKDFKVLFIKPNQDYVIFTEEGIFEVSIEKEFSARRVSLNLGLVYLNEYVKCVISQVDK